MAEQEASQEKKNIAGSLIRVPPAPEALRIELQVPPEKPLFCVTVDGEVLRTPNGKPIVHEDQRAMRELAAELEYSDELDATRICLYGLFSTQIDFVAPGHQEFTSDFIQETLLEDLVFRPAAGPEAVEQLKYLQAVEVFLEANKVEYLNLPQTLIDEEWLASAPQDFHEKLQRLIGFVSDRIHGLSDSQFTVFITAAHVFESPTLALMLATKNISPREFAVVQITSLEMNSKIWSDSERQEDQAYLQQYTQQAECMLRYLDLFVPRLTEVERIIKTGESVRVEFKSTLRWNTKAARQDPEMEHAVLKTIVAFLNTDGGTLLIGVEDNGNIIGTSADRFQNEDKYLLYLVNRVNTKVGKEYSPSIRYEFQNAAGKRVLLVKCERSSKAAFLRSDDKQEFFVRIGPSSEQLYGSELLEYHKQHFSE